MTVYIDLNADLGEGDPNDAELLSIVSSCNIACGGHAGDQSSMRTTVERALRNGVTVGAHPSYPDREGFGRNSRYQTDSSLHTSLCEQIHSLGVIAQMQGTSIVHVKPHGALYNDAADDHGLAAMVAAATTEAAPGAALVGMPASELENAARSLRIPFIAEAFVDRMYRDDGRLLSRSEPNAVYDDVERIVGQAVSLATTNSVPTNSGRMLRVVAGTLCIHGDTSNAASAARAVRLALQHHGVEIRAVGR